MLDNRLGRVAALVRRGSRLADIGTDHARLPVWLVREGICPHAVAADIRTGPADAARRTIAAAGLEQAIEVRVGDGLAPLKPGEADDIVIAGMGGETIAAILDACSWAKDARYHWILQPMTRPEALRRWLLTNGFSLLSESVATEGRRLYLVLETAYTGAPPTEDEAAYYIGVLPAAEAAYLRGVANRVRRRAQGLARREPDGAEAARLAAVAQRIERYIEEGGRGDV